ncbi:methionine adenosyltransferase [Aquimarina celericrescens]|uniref:Methionine adenosyltransferase n=1 Tax=Aquimarina celericrescens TaxID=1964542 RepID=A0ABW5AR87_9FLAO|nr:methionine adenosyltransferase [Aquimarina celericrescens]
MARNIIIGELTDDTVEMAERKGVGHPDTMCDEITEQISIALCDYYLKEFGTIMHHNVDKALLIGGQSEPTYHGGKVIKPISLIIVGRATWQVKDKKISVEEIALETAKKWLKDNIKHLDNTKDIEVTAKIRPGSTDLVELFNRFGKGEIPLANDTSFGAGFYPLTTVENTIISIEKLLNDPITKNKFPFVGEDIKVMGVKEGSKKYFTIAIAMIDRYISDLNDYISKIESVKEFIAASLNLPKPSIQINTADDYKCESIYLTVTGTSAEHGDDGQVGRGNRINGLITPYYPMSMEATSGKNPVSHTGKIYNYFAMDLSRAVVQHQFADQARVFILSQIGKPIDQPQILHFQLKNRKVDKKEIESLAKEKLGGMSTYWKRILHNDHSWLNRKLM